MKGYMSLCDNLLTVTGHSFAWSTELCCGTAACASVVVYRVNSLLLSLN